MVKIWEVDFANFVGSGNTALDNVGSQNLSSHQNIQKVSPLPGFTFRPGINFSRANNIVQYYDLDASGVTNGKWVGTWSQRSFVVWLYVTGEAVDSTAAVWGHIDGAVAQNGIVTRASYNLALYFNLSQRYQEINFFNPSNTGWHSVIVTIDRLSPEVNMYIDGSNVYSAADLVGETSGGTLYIGDVAAADEASFSLGYMASYDHVLQSSEISSIVSTFLADSITGERDLVRLQGVVVDDSLNLKSGWDVFLVRQDNGQVVAKTVTNASGEYQLNIPLLGEYTLVAANPPNIGSRAVPLTLVSTSPLTINFHV